MLLLFLDGMQDFARPLIDLGGKRSATKLNLYTYSSANPNLGFGGWFKQEFFFGKWDRKLLIEEHPSIQYLKLYAVCMVLFVWEEKLANSRIIVNCDNKSMCRMVDNITSGCRNCMILVRRLVLHGLKYNTRVFTSHVRSEKNSLADHLSRLKLAKFFNEAPDTMKRVSQLLHPNLWPLAAVWKQD